MPGSSRPNRFLTLRWKIFGVVSAVVVLWGALDIVLGTDMDGALRKEHDRKGAALAGSLAAMSAESILVDDRVALTSLLVETRETGGDVVYAFVVDENGRVISHSFPGPFPQGLFAIARTGDGVPGRSADFQTEKGLVADFSAPILGGKIGTLHLGVSQKDVEDRIAESRTRVALVTAGFLLAGLLLSQFLGAYITRPLEELARAAEEIGAGNLDRRAFVGTRDEIGVLSRAFNKMAEDLRGYLQARKDAEESLRRAHDELELRVRDRTAQLAAANRELEAFSYSVSHDLRAPLRAVDGFSLALMEDCGGKLDATGQDYLRRIRDGCQRMGRLIDDILKLSRISRGELRRERVDLSDMARSIAEGLRESSPGRTVEVAVAPGIVVAGDPDLLRAAMTNLLENAWKFTRQREDARIDVGRVRKDGKAVCFVRDNGVGFDMRYADKLFGVFQRLHSGAEFEGSGIGLATVKRVIHRHGGMIWAEGEPEKGATFYFTLDGGPT